MVDRVGWFGGPGATYEPVTPVRLLDTRVGLGRPGTAKHPAEATLALTVPGLAADATAVVLNVTATEPEADGFLTVWPCGEPRPLASNLNFTAEQLSAPNYVAVRLGPGQQVCLSGNATTHVIADHNGTYRP